MKTVLIASVLAGCATPPPDSPTPTVTSTSVDPSPVAAAADGSYAFKVTFKYSDDVDVQSWAFVAGTATVDGTIATPQHNGATSFNVTLGAGTPSGTLDYTVTITDAMSRTSDDGQGTVVLDPP